MPKNSVEKKSPIVMRYYSSLWETVWKEAYLPSELFVSHQESNLLCTDVKEKYRVYWPQSFPPFIRSTPRTCLTSLFEVSTPRDILGILTNNIRKEIWCLGTRSTFCLKEGLNYLYALWEKGGGFLHVLRALLVWEGLHGWSHWPAGKGIGANFGSAKIWALDCLCHSQSLQFCL